MQTRNKALSASPKRFIRPGTTRITMTDTTETLVFYTDKRKAIHRLRLRFIFILIPMLLAYAGGAHLAEAATRREGAGGPGSLMPYFVWFLAIEIAALCFFVTKGLKQQAEPVVTLSPDGIRVHAQLQDIGFVGWEEIADARAYTFIYRYVGIVPKDTGAICGRIGRRRSLTVWLNDWCIRLFYRPLHIFVAPINIP